MENKFEQPQQPEEEFEKLEIMEEPEFEELEIIKEDLPEERAMEIFDPKEEMKKIKKLPREEKREALAEYKEKLARQKEGLAGLQDRLISVIRKNPDISHQDFTEIIEKEGKELKLTEGQKFIARTFFSSYELKHGEIKKIRADYPDDVQLFKKLFGKEPKGKIEVIEGPIMLYFRCFNPEDYAPIDSGAFIENRELTKEEWEVANKSGAITVIKSLVPGLESSLVAENTQEIPPESRKKIFIHEEQHVIKHFFREALIRAEIEEELPPFETNDEARLFSERLFRYWREGAEHLVKDEILAYMKSGENSDFTFEKLTKTAEQKGLYDFLQEIREKDVPKFINKNSEYKEIFAKAAKTVLEDEYKALIKRGIIFYKFLVTRMGYFPDRAISLLMTEPLIKWPKVVRRLYDEQSKKPK